MCKLKALILGVVLVLGLVVPAQASLIGDEVTVEHNNGLRIINLGSHLVTTSDENISFFSSYQIDIEAESIIFDFIAFGTFGQTALVTLSDLDWVGMSGEVTGVTTTSTFFPGWSNSRATFTSDSVSFDFSDTEIIPSTSLTATLQTAHTPVPIPSAFLLMGTGLLGLIGYRKWSNKAN